MSRSAGVEEAGGARVASLAAVVFALVVGAALVPAVAGQDATTEPTCDTGADDDSAVFRTDGGLAVTHDGRSLAGDPFVNDTTLAFANVTVRGGGNASVRVVSAARGTTCLADVRPADGDLVFATAEGPTVRVGDSVERLSYGAIDDESGQGDTALAYSAPTDARIELRDEALRPGQPVRVLAAEDGSVLASATVGPDGALALSLPAGNGTLALQSDDGSTPTPSTATPTAASVGNGPDDGDDGPGTIDAEDPFSTGLASHWSGQVVDYRPSPQTTHVGGFLPLTLVSLALALWLAIARRTREARWLAAVLAVAAVRSATDLLQALLDDLVGVQGSIAAANLALELTTAVLFLQFGAVYADVGSIRADRTRAALGGLGAIGVVVALTDPLHGLVFADVTVADGPFSYVTRTFEPVGWALYGLTAGAVLTGGGLVLRALAGPPLRTVWRPVAVVGSGLTLAVAIAVASLRGVGPVANYDYTASGVNYFLAAMAFTLSSYGFRRLSRTGRRSVVETLEDPVVVLDDAWRVVYWNDRTQRVLPSIATGGSFDEFLPDPLERPAIGARTRTTLQVPVPRAGADDEPAAAEGDSHGPAPDGDWPSTSTDGGTETGRAVSPAAPDGSPDAPTEGPAGDEIARGPDEPSPDRASDDAPEAPEQTPITDVSPDESDSPGAGGPPERTFVATATAVTAPSETRIGYAVQFVDVTELRRREAVLAERNERLDRLSTVVSEDLGGPLVDAERGTERALAIVAAAEEPATLDRDRLGDSVDRVGRALGRMRDLIDDVLGVVRASPPSIDPDSVQFGRVATEAWDRVDAADARVLVGADGRIRADADALRRVLEHLFRNAVEHGDGGPTGPASDGVTIRVALTDDGFFLADDGPGVPSSVRADCFEAGVTTDADGSGLGLAAVDRLARAHGWTVTLDDESAGARFAVLGCETTPGGTDDPTEGTR